jgi:uncharacterized protein
MKYPLAMKYSLFSVLLLVATLIHAQVDVKDLPARPTPPKLVNDLADVLSPSQEQALEQKLVAFDDSTSTQIAVITMQSTGRYPIEDYALYLGRNWGVGQEGMNNGVVLLAAIKDRKVTVQVGYGIEPYITDGRAKRIIENDILPAFRNSDYNAGIDAGVDRIIEYVSGEFAPKDEELSKPMGIGQIIFIIIVVILILILMSRSNRGGGVT